MKQYKGRFWVHNHQNKAEAFIGALLDAGYLVTEERARARFQLMDLDVLGRTHWIDEATRQGIPTFLYPHAARPPVQWDGMYARHPDVKAHFVFAEGHTEIMRSYGYTGDIIPVGWTYCNILPFKPNLKPVNVLFAPVHANQNGYLCEVHRKMNEDAFTILAKLHRDGKIHLRIRYLHRYNGSGCWVEPGTEIITGRADQSVLDIDQADVVVAHQTFAYLSVARGKPTIMFNEDLPPCSGNSSDNLVYAASFEKYKHLLQFPYDLLKAESPLDLIYRAAVTDEDIADWRTRIIGKPFDPEHFVSSLEAYL